jgi:hypothetical protein
VTEAEWIDFQLRRLQVAGEQFILVRDLVEITRPGEVDAWKRRHHSFRVHHMVDGSLCFTKRARISRNRWL